MEFLRNSIPVRGEHYCKHQRDMRLECGCDASELIKAAKRDDSAIPARGSYFAIRTSAIWMAFCAAPFQMLSPEHQSTRPLSTLWSLRIRPTSTS